MNALHIGPDAALDAAVRTKRSVAPASGGGWQVTSTARPQDLLVYATEQEAHDLARRALAKQGGGELITQNADGRITARSSVAPDSVEPTPSQG